MMEQKPNPCGCLRDCPCYPDCDRLMSEGRLPGRKPPVKNEKEPERRMPVWMQAKETPRPRSGQDDLAQLARENETDWKKLKELYPDMARILLAQAEEACDSLEYEGSMMYDEMPDKVRLQKMTEAIYDRMKERYPVEETDDRDEMLAMNRERQRRYPPKQNWLSDFIQSMLCQEMFRRRCRNRSCRFACPRI